MAITQTILTTPPTHSPVYNKIEVQAKENDLVDLAEPNYTFVIDVETETLGTERFFVKPDPILSYGKKNASGMLEGFIEETIAQYNSSVSFAFGLTRPIIKYRFNIYQGWDVAGVFTVDPDTEGAVSTAWLYAWDGTFNNSDWIDEINDGSPFDTWILNTANGVNGEFLTPWKTPKVSIIDLGWHSLLTDEPANIDYVEIKTYDSVGALIQTVNATNCVASTVTASKFLTLATAPQSLNNIVAGITLGAQPIITSAVDTYTVQVFRVGPTIMSEKLLFTIEEPCRYEVFRLHFLNELGGFDSFTFRDRSQQTNTITKKQYNRTSDNIQTAGLQYLQQDNGKQDYNSKESVAIKLRSDYILDNDKWQWLRELVGSPLVYLEFTASKGTRNFKPVRVTSSNWIDKDVSIDKIFRLELDIALAHENFKQRR